MQCCAVLCCAVSRVYWSEVPTLALPNTREIPMLHDFVLYIGIFNPRLNRIYTYDMTQADTDMLEIIRKEVIGYD